MENKIINVNGGSCGQSIRNLTMISLFLGYCQEDGNGIGISVKNNCMSLPIKYIEEFEHDLVDEKLYIYYIEYGTEQEIVLYDLGDCRVEEYDEFIDIIGKNGMEIRVEELF